MHKQIYIPHIGFTGFTVKVGPIPRGHPTKAYACAYSYYDKNNNLLPRALIVLPKGATCSAVAHEVTHVVQTICEYQGIDFIKETEHTACLVQYLMEKIMGNRKTVS